MIPGPFSETNQLIAGFWLWRAESLEKAIEWLKKAPFGGGVEIELRPLFELDDFGAKLTPELRKKEEQLRKQIEQPAKGSGR